jgi:MFS family permease
LTQTEPRPSTPADPALLERASGQAPNGRGAVAAAPETAGPRPRTAVRPRARFSIRTFESLKDRDFRWFFLSMFGHFTAMNMQMFIRGYLVFQLTGSYAALGAIQLASAFPQLLLSLVGGVIADQIPQKKHMVQIGQAVNALNALWIGAVLFFGALGVEHLVIAALVQGLMNALMMPSRQAMTPEIVGLERLMNALALNTAGMNFARLMMPAFAGWLVGALGPGYGPEGAEWVYFLMGGLYFSAVVSLFKVPNVIGRPQRERSVRAGLSDTAEGFRYIVRTPVVRTILLVNLLMVVFSMPYFFLLPGFVDDVLGQGATGLGILMSVQGLGSLAGSLVIASLPSRHRGRILLASGAVLGVSLLAFLWSEVYWISALLFIGVGLGQAGRMSLSNVLVQSYTEDAYRGRVMSIYMMEFSMVMFATFFVGLFANVVGPQVALSTTTLVLLGLIAYLFLFVRSFRDLE